jgi:hypothetical protein
MGRKFEDISTYQSMKEAMKGVKDRSSIPFYSSMSMASGAFFFGVA